MPEIGLFHNGASSLPVIAAKDGVTFNDGSLAEVHRAAQETLVNQLCQGLLAEKLGFQSFWLTRTPFPARGHGDEPRLSKGEARTDRISRVDEVSSRWTRSVPPARRYG